MFSVSTFFYQNQKKNEINTIEYKTKEFLEFEKSAKINIDKAWGRVRARADVTDVRLHDLRRTAGSWLAQSGASLHLIGKVLNHANTSTTAIYAHFGQDQVRDAMDRLGQEMLTGAGKVNLLEVDT